MAALQRVLTLGTNRSGDSVRNRASTQAKRQKSGGDCEPSAERTPPRQVCDQWQKLAPVGHARIELVGL